MTNGPFVASEASMPNVSGRAGSLTVSAPGGDILFAGAPKNANQPGQLFNEATRGTGGFGGIQVTAKNLTLTNAGITGDNFSSNVPWNITVTLSGTLSLDGQNLNFTLIGVPRNITLEV